MKCTRLGARVFSRRYVRPPTHFSNPNSLPSQFGDPEPEAQHEFPGSQELKPDLAPNAPKDRLLKDLSTLLGMFALAYLALDNYSNRVKLEKLNQETTAINLKTLQLQQQNFVHARKQQDLKMLQERVDVSKRCFRMAMHIAMLRAQLVELGVKPVDINDVVAEFEKNVRINNSVQNLTGHAMWLDEASEYSGQLPDYREYDRKTGKT